MTDIEKELYWAFFQESLDTEKAIRRILYKGFDNYRDYFIYGELFQELAVPKEADMAVDFLAKQKVTVIDNPPCPYCSGDTIKVSHQGKCPKIKSIEYFDGGFMIKRIEFFPDEKN